MSGGYAAVLRSPISFAAPETHLLYADLVSVPTFFFVTLAQDFAGDGVVTAVPAAFAASAAFAT